MSHFLWLEKKKIDPLENEEDMDDDLKNIVRKAKQQKPSSATSPTEPSGPKLAEMTYDQKMEWLAKKKEERKKKLEIAELEKIKESEKSRKTITKAASKMKEKIEENQAKTAYDARKKEERERKAARKKILDKIAQDKLERKAKG